MPSNATPRSEPAIPRNLAPNGSTDPESSIGGAARAPQDSAAGAPASRAEPRATRYDVFLSHSSKDKAQADAICALLEANGLQCWIAPRNINPGRKWDEAIMDGIASSRAVLLIHSANANRSDDVEREIAHASDADLPILPLRLEDVPLSKAMHYHLVQSQWLDAFPPPLDSHFPRLVDAVRDLVNRPPETTGQRPVPDPGPSPNRVIPLRELVSLGPLVALDLLVGTWVALNARGAIEWATANVGVGAVIAVVWKLLPNQTTERARQDFARAFSSRKLALWLSVGCVAFVVLTAFVSTVQLSATEPRAGGNDSAARLPVTVVVRDASDEGTDGTGASARGADGAHAVSSARLSTWDERRSVFVPIAPFGRRVWLEASARERTRHVRLIPWVPRPFIYPADFEAPTLAVLPSGSLVFDIVALPRVVVYAEGESGSTIVADAALRSMGAMLFSTVAPPGPDSVTRARWMRTVQARAGVDSTSAKDAVAVWSTFRWVKTRQPLKFGDRLRVVVLSGADTLASDTLTLSASATDVYLTRRP